MLAGLSPLFSGAELVKMTYRDGSAHSVLMESSSLKFKDQSYTSLERVPSKINTEDLKVAVLTSPDTASAGELVAIALKSLKKSRLFGQKTAGMTTNNEKFDLSDGSALFLATSYYTDIQGNVYESGITPDVILEKEENTREDAVLQEALDWVLED